ncbi:unnamed protein product [Rhizoctonia solani]|uniref:Fungal-type protein kinase domain-containing protein n=1 Tax=Rhizoctonia solani TaxID=456999 RepID=A0A8H3GTH2_9AGAM|nr:unnamed protein product [Rhizoctonia solani]
MLRVSNNVTIPHPPSSPIRKGSPLADTRTATEIDKLNSKGLRVRDVAGENGWVTRIQRTIEGQETSLNTDIAPLLCLLNHISERIFDALPGQKVLVFRSGNCRVKSPFTDHYCQPDVVVEWEEVQEFPQNYSVLSTSKTWTKLATVGEIKVSQSRKGQLASYLRNHLQFHPELNAVLGFTAQRDGYALFYHDAAVIHRSEFRWESGPLALYAFIGKLYTQPYRDQSIQISDVQAPTWAIKIGNDVYVSMTETLEMLAGPGQRRQTGMWKNLATDEVVFIKDIWRHLSRLFFEGLLLKQAHHLKSLCGLAVYCAYGYVLDENHARVRTTSLDPGSVEEQVAGRFKMRLVTEEIGSPLNGGTPKFIARSISSGRLLNKDASSSKGVDMPLLDGLSAGYRQFMHTTEYQVAHNPGPEPAKVGVVHRLFHDAESTVWVIAWTFITSVKTRSEPESGPREDFSDFFYTMRNHFPQPGFRDSREGLALLFAMSDSWETALHPDLAMLASMLTNIFRYILPEWAHQPDLDDEHVHEALMRLLLAEIVKIKDDDTDIEIDIGGRQPPSPRDGVNPLPHSASNSRTKDSTQSRTGRSTEPIAKKPSRSTEQIPNNKPDRGTWSGVLRSDTAARARAEQQNEQQNLQQNLQQEVSLSWSMDTCELQEPEQVLELEADLLELKL